VSFGMGSQMIDFLVRECRDVAPPGPMVIVSYGCAGGLREEVSAWRSERERSGASGAERACARAKERKSEASERPSERAKRGAPERKSERARATQGERAYGLRSLAEYLLLLRALAHQRPQPPSLALARAPTASTSFTCARSPKPPSLALASLHFLCVLLLFTPSPPLTLPPIYLPTHPPTHPPAFRYRRAR
jgi:hypothetical protein